MELSPEKWNSEQVRVDVDYNGINHFKMESLHLDTLGDFTNEQYLLSLPEGSFGNSISSETFNPTFFATDEQVHTNNHSTNMVNDNIVSESFERPAKQIKTNSWNPSPVKQATAISSSSSSQIISFSNVSSQTMDHQELCDYSRDVQLVQPYEDMTDLNATYDNDNYTVIAGKPIRRPINPATVRAPSHVQDHVIAERKRRERLTERFIALSAIVPGLKKLDKASVLGDAVKYLKQLQQRVDSLEEQIKKKKKFEESSIVSPNDSCKLPAASSEGYSSCDENSGGYTNRTAAEIEARVLEKNVLVRVHCKKQKGFVPRMLREMEKLHLTVISSNVLPFGDHAMDITIISQMEAECSLTVEDLVRRLQSALR